MSLRSFSFFFFNDTAPTEIYPLSLHDALPISVPAPPRNRQFSCRSAANIGSPGSVLSVGAEGPSPRPALDRKSTRLNSSHGYISYAVFCLKKKKKKSTTPYSE